MDELDKASRLLLVTPDYPPNRGGVATYLSSMKRYFGDRMEVVQSDLLFKRVWPKWLKTTLRLIKQRSTYDYVVTSHVIPFGTAALLAKWVTKKPYLVIVHGLDIRLVRQSAIKSTLAGLVLRSAHLVVANSNALAQELSVFGLSQALVVYPCLDSIPSSIRKPEQKKRLLTVSRLVPRKGHERVLRALAELGQAGRLGDIEYHIVGTGPYEEQIRSTVHSLNLDSIVFFHGEVSDEEKRSVYQQSDVFVMPVVADPIDKEGFGLVYMEAASYGVPSIATNISGIDEAIINGETGILIEDNNIPELATWIDRLLTNQQEREQLGKAAYDRAQEEFTCERQFSKLEPYL
jgi:phosphatidylinositol alpha-1,6-mannosyltransferase